MSIRSHHVLRVAHRLQRLHPEHAASIQTVIDTPEMFDALVTKTQTDLPPAPTGRPILDWLIAHGPQILQFIMSIIAMFAAGS